MDGNLTDLSSLIRILQACKPNEVYNLAAQSFVAASWQQPLLTGGVTGLGCVNMLEAMRIAAPNARFYQASSSEIFGNLNAQRDWGHAADYVDAMWRMLQQDEGDDYVVGTGRTATIHEFCRLAFGHVGLNCEDHVVTRQDLLRPAEVEILQADPSKARQRLGWQPTVSLEALAAEMVEAALARYRERARG